MATFYLFSAGFFASVALLVVASCKGDLLWTGVMCLQCSLFTRELARLAKGRGP